MSRITSTKTHIRGAASNGVCISDANTKSFNSRLQLRSVHSRCFLVFSYGRSAAKEARKGGRRSCKNKDKNK